MVQQNLLLKKKLEVKNSKKNLSGDLTLQF